jgi:hypothetical protein
VGAPPPQPVAAGALQPPPRPPTLCEFAANFKAGPGTFEVCLVHPVTHCPVKVCFTLPCGCPKKVKVQKHELKFDYGRHDVELHFKRDGTVKVKYG